MTSRKYERGYLQGLKDAADEIAIEARWQQERRTRGLVTDTHEMIKRLLMVESTLRAWVSTLEPAAREAS